MLMTRCSKSDLAALFGVSVLKVERWSSQGMPQGLDGFYTLSEALRWILKGLRTDLGRKLLQGSLTQKELTIILQVSRQTITEWGRAGLPRRVDGTYSLGVVMRWLKCHYLTSAKKEYEQRLVTLQKKICRNVRQLEKFLAGNNKTAMIGLNGIGGATRPPQNLKLKGK